MSGRGTVHCVSTQLSPLPLPQVHGCTKSRVFPDYHCKVKLSALTSATLKERGNGILVSVRRTVFYNIFLAIRSAAKGRITCAWRRWVIEAYPA